MLLDVLALIVGTVAIAAGMLRVLKWLIVDSHAGKGRK